MTKVKANTATASLSDILSQEVIAPAVSVPLFTPEEPAAAEAVLTPEEPAESITNYVNTDQGNQEQVYEDQTQSLSPDDIATIGVNLLDGVQRFAFAFMRKKMMFTDDELELLPNIDPSEGVIYDAGSKQAILQAKYKKHLSIIRDLPFRDDEKERLTEATKIYARTTKITVSPFTGLLLAYSEVLGLRAVNVFTE